MTAPAPVTAVNEEGGSRYVLLCEHASNHIPDSYGRLGLSEADLGRHIAWDIGAAGTARHLSELLDAPLYLSGYSRLLIDCNRPPGAPTSIPARSEDTDIPGNQGLTQEERDRRANAYFHPFRAAVTEALDRRQAAGKPTAVVGIHSFTPVFLTVPRVWQAGILYAAAREFAQALIANLGRQTGLKIGDNEPYRVSNGTDYTVPVHGDGRGLDAVLVEIRQDLLTDAPGMKSWAERLAAALRECDSG